MLTRSDHAPRHEGSAVHFIMLLESGRGISCKIGREALVDHLQLPGQASDGHLGQKRIIEAFAHLRPRIEAIAAEKFASGMYGLDDTIVVTLADLTTRAHAA